MGVACFMASEDSSSDLERYAHVYIQFRGNLTLIVCLCLLSCHVIHVINVVNKERIRRPFEMNLKTSICGYCEGIVIFICA